MKYNGLDVYDITLGIDDVGITATSLVALPAIESSFLYFNKETPQFQFSNEEKGELIGAFMIPDKLIYRDVQGHKFYVNFTKEVIKELVSKMIKTGAAGLFTIQHKYDASPGIVDIQEIWIKESENDKSVDFGIDEPLGSAFMKVKINDDGLRKHIKEFGLTGFSVELDASIVKKNELLFKQEEIKTEKMKITDLFSKSVMANGISLHFNKELKKNAYLVFEGEDGKPETYTGTFTSEGVEYVVEDGLVTEANDIALTTSAVIEGLQAQFAEVRESISALLAAQANIEEREAELELLRSQFEAEKLALKNQAKPQAVSLKMSETIPANGVASKTWLNKFAK